MEVDGEVEEGSAEKSCFFSSFYRTCSITPFHPCLHNSKSQGFGLLLGWHQAS